MYTVIENLKDAHYRRAILHGTPSLIIAVILFGVGLHGVLSHHNTFTLICAYIALILGLNQVFGFFWKIRRIWRKNV